MDLEEVEKITEAFIKRKRNSTRVKIDSVEHKNVFRWMVRGYYSTGAEEALNPFQLEVSDRTGEVVAYKFEGWESKY